MTMTSSYDDGEDIATPEDDFTERNRSIIEAIRAIPDPAVRRAVMILVVLLIFKGRAGR
jgi:hypothetical protein